MLNISNGKENYLKYRGKCRELAEEAVAKDPSLTLVRGYYHEPLWNTEQQHWWTKRTDGTIYDPSAKQFPSGGIHSFYKEFNGVVSCSECGKEMQEEDMQLCGNYPVCSTKCALNLTGALQETIKVACPCCKETSEQPLSHYENGEVCECVEQIINDYET